MFAGAGLKLLGGAFVHAVDGQQFVHLDIGDFFRIGEAFGDQKLGEEVVQIQRIRRPAWCGR